MVGVWSTVAGSKHITAESEHLDDYRLRFDIPTELHARVSTKFWFDVLVFSEAYGIDPSEILSPVLTLECNKLGHSRSASIFRKPPLVGLWHIHFTSARFLAANIITELGKNGLEQLIWKESRNTPENVVTPDFISRVAKGVVEGQYEKRARRNALTGEWIIFAKFENVNYYLSVAIHSTPDQEIFDQIVSLCKDDFPFLFASR